MAPGELSALPAGESIFIDSNILTYHLLNDPLYGTRCKELFKKVDLTAPKEYDGWTAF